MDKKPYETPQLQMLGAVQELTKETDFNTGGSADLFVSFQKCLEDDSTLIDPCVPET